MYSDYKGTKIRVFSSTEAELASLMSPSNIKKATQIQKWSNVCFGFVSCCLGVLPAEQKKTPNIVVVISLFYALYSSTRIRPKWVYYKAQCGDH